MTSFYGEKTGSLLFITFLLLLRVRNMFSIVTQYVAYVVVRACSLMDGWGEIYITEKRLHATIVSLSTCNAFRYFPLSLI